MSAPHPEQAILEDLARPAGRTGSGAQPAGRAHLAQPSAVGQHRMAALHGGRRDGLEIYPNLWAGIGVLPAGPGPHSSAATSRLPT